MRGPKVNPARVHARGVVPQPARRRRGQPPEELPTIDSTWLSGVVGGRQLPATGTDPKMIAGLKGLTDAIIAAGKATADKIPQGTQQMLQLLGDFLDKKKPAK